LLDIYKYILNICDKYVKYMSYIYQQDCFQENILETFIFKLRK